ncbi:MAG: hypothetical protein JWN68_3279 [Nocardioides sp.]|jgi:hypothetical protein|uniref:hypothetical protein n=1 Tax=Nocardioides sp. TaxID=35761 RepID=UPI00262F3450|nr:hypothetical protein [Nocardioides sp.]MCW2835326.1 hypothetical protein [Nocardioides sp.]
MSQQLLRRTATAVVGGTLLLAGTSACGGTSGAPTQDADDTTCAARPAPVS